jgi:hypothetical protein
MAIEDLDQYDIEYIDFYAEIPSTRTVGEVDEKRDYIDSINTEITDLHDSSDSAQGLSDKQVSQLAEDQFQEAVRTRSSQATQDATLFSDNL